VSGCIRECAEAQSKDFGIIATEKGWNLYLAGNGGTNPRHADLVASDVDEATVLRLIDRFLMFYIHTANPLERTARWVERQDGGIEYVKSVIADDALGICDALDRDMQALVDGYQCEWKAVVEDPERRRAFAHFANSEQGDPALRFVREREQKRPADWPQVSRSEPQASDVHPGGDTAGSSRWIALARVADFPRDGGRTVQYGVAQLAVFHFATRGEWYATQAACPHRRDMVLGRGLLGSQAGEPKVACPLHKKTFSLATGRGLSDPHYAIRTFPVEVRGDDVYALLPPAESLLATRGTPCSVHS
jgi:nitrite reductase (NADH) large subunit